MNEQQKNNNDFVYSNLERLIRLKYDIRGFSYLPKQPVQSKLTGKHRSRLRGRGLDFEEVRNYNFGDDIRNIDWKVTARTKKPHTKVYTEERERPVFIVVDQSAAMFFGSGKYMKSVIAAETAALSAWKVLAVGDRIGGMVFNDLGFDEIKPKRSRKNVLQFLNMIASKNEELNVKKFKERNSGMLNKILSQTLKFVTHDFLLVVISDFSGYDNETFKLLIQLSKHNDVIAVKVTDSLELSLDKNMIIGLEESQINLADADVKMKNKYKDFIMKKNKLFKETLTRYNVTFLELNTAQSSLEQVRNLIGSRR